MIKENEEVELELREALSLKDIHLIKPVVMDENCASSNSSLNIIPKKTVAVEVGQSRFIIDNVVQALQVPRRYVMGQDGLESFCPDCPPSVSGRRFPSWPRYDQAWVSVVSRERYKWR
ncbi:unnamed protein product [Mucor circinelloides]